MRGALIGAVLFEGLAATPSEAERHARGGGRSRGSRATTAAPSARWPASCSPSMWVFELLDDAHDRRSWCTLNEGLGKVLRYGAYSPDVIERLRWMTDVLGPALQTATRARGPIDIRAIIAQMIQMGDEGHNRNRAGTLMLLREWLPDLITSGLPDAPTSPRWCGSSPATTTSSSTS